jgi:hypothetical protein
VLAQEGPHEARIGGRDADALEVLERGESPGGARETEGRAAESELLDLASGLLHVEEEIATGDPDIECAGGHVRGDVTRAEEEELDVVLGVDHVQGLGVAAAGISGLREHLGGSLRERALVGNGNAQHVWLSDRIGMGGAHHRCR